MKHGTLSTISNVTQRFFVSVAFVFVDSEKRKRTFHPMARFLPPANEVCEGYVFTDVCLATGGLSVSVQGGGLCPGEGGLGPGKEGLCPGEGVSFQGRGSLSRGGGSLSRGGGLCPGEGVSVHPGKGSLSRGVGSLSGGSLSGGSLSRGSLFRGSLFRGSLSREFSVQVGSLSGKPPQTETPYGNERVVRILLECNFVVFDFKTRLFT